MPKVGSPREYRSGGRVVGYRIQWTMPDGKRKGKTFPLSAFGGDRAAARKAATAELRRVWGELQAIADGRLAFDPDAERMTLGEFFESKWKPERSINRNRPEANGQLFAHLKCIEHLSVRRINLDAVKLVLVELTKKGLSAESQRKVLGFLRTMLNHAKVHDPVVNPPSLRGVMPPARVYEGRIIVCKEQVEAFLKATERTDARTLYAVAVYAGLRAGELAGLQWGDIDFVRRLIHVRRSYDHEPKTRKPRTVPIFDELLPLLEVWKKETRSTDAERLVFPSNAQGGMWRHDSSIFRRIFHAAIENAEWPEPGRHELPRLRFHDLRHSFASLWIMDGGDMNQLLRMGGWSSYKMVDERYGKFAPERYRGTAGTFTLTRSDVTSKPRSERKNREQGRRGAKSRQRSPR